MNQILEFFTKRAYILFERAELNEFLIMTYQELGQSVSDKNDKLILTKEKLIHMRQEKIVRETSLIYGDSSIYEITKNSLMNILDKDDIAGRFFKIEYENENEIVIKLNLPENLDIESILK